ncbi:processed acidic surface protein [Heyndrickxia sporothermodurans]|uniref:processed acidic surface protein n=1 Tax=Heyndrickxia sporothermodurans TaxID=46224 RepID=UPI002E1DB0A9|nr:processed acidic surface protein [Heyndrickxia sporothermodurans]MED3649432.1 processed acidic surface protein [Heyndrickxia sporothermodurans]MED3696446.1 processed acidic surface protein [Heyndrickxia sporothermodurans]
MKRILLFIGAIFLCFTVLPKVSFAAPNKAELQTYLESIGMTEKELNEHLEYFYNTSIKSFSTINDIKKLVGEPLTENNLQKLIKKYEFKDETDVKNFLVKNGEMGKTDNIYDVYHFTNALDDAVSFYIGTPITDKNLKELLKEYDMTYDEMVNLLKSNGDSIDNYEFIEDLEDALISYSDDSISDIFSDIFDKVGLTDEEVGNLLNHFMSLKLDENVENKLNKLSERMMAIGDFESKSDLSEKEINEIVNVYQEMLNIFKLNTKFYLVKGSDKKPISLNELAQLTSTNGYNLLIEIYDNNGKLLADLILTPDMFGSELIKDTAEKVKKVEKAITTPMKKTVRGGKLPNTAGHYGDYLLGGLLLLAMGIFLFRRWRSINI